MVAYTFLRSFREVTPVIERHLYFCAEVLQKMPTVFLYTFKNDSGELFLRLESFEAEH